ncbi:hypothetical protein, partial [Agathobaculum sp.]|uniref:hypothetical protein n=1 Tax=Agathobaculum sp. TaxID=2048138 RepID=UPI00399FB0C2
SASLVRMRSPVQIRSAAPAEKPVVPRHALDAGLFSYSVLGGGQKRAIQETMERDAQKSDNPWGRTVRARG